MHKLLNSYEKDMEMNMDTGIKASALTESANGMETAGDAGAAKTTNKPGRRKISRIAKVLIFLLIAAVIFGYINQLAQPIWKDWSNFDRTEGFYELQDNTLETVFVGTSVVVNGIIPAELYENYGICSYNLGSEQQPMLASYYWVEEAYRLHSETLDTVVLDVSAIRSIAKNAFYRKALDGMEMSMVKLHAVKDYASGFSEMISMLIPVFSYHDRWESLTSTDFQKDSMEPNLYLRGYHMKADACLNTVNSYTDISLPKYEVDETAEKVSFVEESETYLLKLIEFCEEHEIQLLLIKTTTYNWTSSLHNSVQAFADAYGLEFLDFTFLPYFDEIDFNFATDTADGSHLNYYGASKLTDYLGAYLTEECGNIDHRGDEEYAFMDEELEEFQNALAVCLESNESVDMEAQLEADLEAGVAYEDLTEAEQSLYQYNLLCEEKRQSFVEEAETEAAEATEEAEEAKTTGEAEAAETGAAEANGETGENDEAEDD